MKRHCGRAAKTPRREGGQRIHRELDLARCSTPFPPVPESMIDAGYKDFAKRWRPDPQRVQETRRSLCVSRCTRPRSRSTLSSAERALKAIRKHAVLRLQLRPEPSRRIKGVDYVEFLRRFARPHLSCPHQRRLVGPKRPKALRECSAAIVAFWRPIDASGTSGRPDAATVDFEEIIRALNDIRYDGPLSVEWEDSGMDRESHGADRGRGSGTRALDFRAFGQVAFDAAFDS